MRILQVRFKNLNSLVGEWQIDLTHPAFASDGIFAITGPTGAGKTTILDAICLALYGRTPRLDKVTRSGNEIMSRQTGECFAEVTFETQTGRFRCHWSQHRARKKPGGELQGAKHEIANADSGEIFESKIKGVADQIVAATGMDFDRFTRSMLLAQGGFAAFLQADPDARAPILEQITGTEIYSQISIRIHERQREEREKLNILEAETAGVVVLDPIQEQEIGQALDTKRTEEIELAAKSNETGKAISWLNTVEGLQKELGNLAEEANTLQTDIAAFKPEREALHQALSAASLDGAYSKLSTTRKQQADDSADLKAQENALPNLESSAMKKADELKSAEQKTGHSKEEIIAASPTLQKVRSLDQKIADQKKMVIEGDEECQRDGAKITADGNTKIEELGKRARISETLVLVDGYINEHLQDEWLIGGLTGIEEQFEGLIAKQAEISQKMADQRTATSVLELATKSLEGSQRQSGTRKQELTEASKQIQQVKDGLIQLLGDRLLREHRAEKDTLLREMAFLKVIADLNVHRTNLEDGKPCPLCGAAEHPYAEGNVPLADETKGKIEALDRLINKAEDQESALKKLEEAEILARKNLTEAEKLEAAAASDKTIAEKTLAEVTASLVKLQSDFSDRKQSITTKLLPFGIEDIPEADIASPLQTLRARFNAWQAKVKQKADFEKQIADIDSEIKRLDAVIETQNTAFAQKLERVKALNKQLDAATEERNALYGNKNPEDEERRLMLAISQAEAAEKLAREQNIEFQQTWNTAKAHVESLRKRIEQREPELKVLEAEFSAALTPLKFANEAQFLESRLPIDRKVDLEARAKKLDDRQTDLKARQKDRETRLASEMATKITEMSLEQLEPQLKEYEESLNQLRDIIAGLKNKLSENAIAKERIKEKRTAIEAQKKECLRWGNLHDLIGSADGKKYRNFAQGLTFEMMVGHANRQLQKMTDRYLLTRDDGQPLDLNVVDNYQAGEIRSTKNLSGGESFIVSLSLALGLSHMASKNVRVDSLFLDEGFGTLDEDALETALETLGGLQQEGKLIGVISHVQALKERISTQIQVTPQTGGRSRIDGPGVT